MEKLSFEDLVFDKEFITIKTNGQMERIRKKDIWTMFYAKWNFINFLTIGNEGITMGILYIAQKSTTKLKDVIRVKFPYKELQKIPKPYFKMIEFFEPGEIADIFSLSKF